MPGVSAFPLLSLAHLTVLPAGPLELFDAAASPGFNAIGLGIQPPLPTDTITPVVGNLPLVREIKSRLSQTGISIVDVEAFWLMPHTSVEGLRPAMETAVELGARHVLIVGNDPDRARVTDRFAALCGMCAEFALRPMLEFIPYTYIRSLPEAHAFLAASGAVNSGILIDALHLSRSGGSPADIPQYPADLFSYVHLCDAPATPPAAEELRGEARGNRLDPGEGELWLKEFIKALPAGTPVAVEIPSTRHAYLAPAARAKLTIKLTRELYRSLDDV